MRAFNNELSKAEVRKTAFVFLFCLSFLFGGVTTIDFTTAGDGYTPSGTQGGGNNDSDDWSDVFNRINYNVSSITEDGYYWAAEDLTLSDPYIDIDQINISEDWQVLFSGIGGPIKVNFKIKENNSIRESQVFELRPGQNFTLNHKNNFLGSNNEFSISISDPEE